MPLLYQLKITLLEVQPPIWRSLQVPANFKLCCLHDVFQISMGWTDSHLHQFEKDGKTWGAPAWNVQRRNRSAGWRLRCCSRGRWRCRSNGWRCCSGAWRDTD